MNDKKWSIYKFVTDDQQEIFKQLIGEAFETEALLVSTHETKDYTEYIFIYNHPTEDTNNLVSFYGKIDNKKAKKSIEKSLLEFATVQLTEKMVTSESKIKTYSKNVNLVEEIASSIKFNISGFEQVGDKFITSSQATYFFDCGNGGKGSFCCILQRLKYKKIEEGTDKGKLMEIDNPENIIPFNQEKSKETLPGYYILTAGHNVNSSTKYYKLIKDANNFVELELVEIETEGDKDAAILKIIGENGKDKLINNRKQFTSCGDPAAEEKIEEFIGYVTKHNAVKIKNPKDSTPYHFTVSEGGDVASTPIKGDSGGAIFSKDNPNVLYGMYRALGANGGVKYSKIEISKKYKLC